MADGDGSAKDELERRRKEIESIGQTMNDLEERAGNGDWQAREMLIVLTLGGDVIDLDDPDEMKKRWDA